MSTQQGQDAKFFQRGKIEVRHPQTGRLALGDELDHVGVPCRTASGGDKGQEISETQDCPEEDCGKYHYGQRQGVTKNRGWFMDHSYAHVLQCRLYFTM